MPKTVLQTLRIDASDWAFFQTILKRGTPNPALDNGVVAQYTVRFTGAIYVLILVVNDEAPHVTATLFLEDGTTQVLDKRFKLLGEYRFSTKDGPDYVVQAIKSKHGTTASQFV